MTYENCSIICRTCLTQNIEMKSIYTIDDIFEEQVQISDILMLCASLQIVKGDGLPEYLCLRCSEELSRAYVFRRLCEKSDAALRGQLTTIIPVHQLDNLKTELSDYAISNNEEITNTYFENNELIKTFEDDIHSDEVLNNESFNINLKKTDDETMEESCRDSNFSDFNEDPDYITNDVVKEEIKEIKTKKRKGAKKLYTCKQCNTKCYGLADYCRHMDVEHTKSFRCLKCNKVFKTETLLKKHSTTHGSKESESLRKCKKRGTKAGVIKGKKAGIIKERNLPRTCNICNKTFRFHSNLERHQLIHTGEKPFLCNVCGKGFAQLSYLKIHSFIHTGEKPYECHICDKSFAAPGTLMTHIRTHTGERPHVCKICGKDFPQSGYLSAHIRTHTGEKPVECKVCHQRFNQSGRLIIHMRIHSGEKPYICKECGRSFAVKGTLKKHIRTHTGERPYVCSSCGQAFAQSGTLATHMKVHRAK